jgi:hypothetical protein
LWLYHKLVTTSTNWIGKNAVLFNIIGLGPRAPHPNIIAALRRRSVLCPPKGAPRDGRPESWLLFKKALHQLLDKEGYGWVVEGGDVFCAMLQVASAKDAKSTVTSGKGTVSTNVADYQKKDLQTAFTNVSVTTSVLLELIANRKTVLRAHHADHDKMGMTEEELAQAHANLDAKRRTMVNRTVVRWLHDAVYPNASETPATIKPRSILKTPEAKILQGEKLTTESSFVGNSALADSGGTHVRSTGVQV